MSRRWRSSTRRSTCPVPRVECSQLPESGCHRTLYRDHTRPVPAPGETVQVEGFNFAPNTTGPLRFVPGSDPQPTPLPLGGTSCKTDATGHFSYEMTLPKRASDDVQYIRATLSQNVGTPHFTQTAKDTWEKIIETVFLALLATTFGTILAIPLSFIAARNLMKPVKSPLASIALSILGWPIGIASGLSRGPVGGRSKLHPLHRISLDQSDCGCHRDHPGVIWPSMGIAAGGNVHPASQRTAGTAGCTYS